MALNITAQDIIIDETTGLQKDDVNPSVPPHNNATVAYLLSLDGPGGLASPEVAFQANFVQVNATAGETITSVILAKDSSGTPFSTTVGVNSGIQTVDGNYVWLFQDATHSNVVIGVIGTSDPTTPPAASGPLAFSFALISTSNSAADLYLVEYVPLLHPDATNPDDEIDLTNKVFAAASGTTTVSFTGETAHPGSNQFNLIASPSDASKQLLVTALVRSDQTDPNSALLIDKSNVSKQGFGVSNQSVEPDSDGQNQPLGHEVLVVDFVTGGTAPSAGDGSQIAYGSHLENITQAGFIINQLTPSTPSERVDISISAFNVQGNAQGLDFYSSSTTPVDIVSIKLTGQSGFASTITTDGTYATGSGNVIISGLSGTGNVVTIKGLDNVTTVDITTASPMDRLDIECVDTNGTGLDITEVHFSGQTTNAVNKEVGSFINFDDDGPSAAIGLTGTNAVLDESLGADPADPNAASDDITVANPDPFGGTYGTPIGAVSKVDVVDTTTAAGADDVGATTAVTLAIVGGDGIDSGLSTTAGTQIFLYKDGATVVGRVGIEAGATDTANPAGAVAFAISINNAGEVTVAQYLSLEHPTFPNSYDEAVNLDSLVNAVVTVTDGDKDVATQSIAIGQAIQFQDDGPTITAPFDADPNTSGIQSPEHLVNAPNQTASGTFGYDIGQDSHPAAFYDATHSDFVDADGTLAGIQIGLTGTVDNSQNPNITQAVATLAAETDTSATFNFSFHYDKDPITAGVQDSTAGGTLVFDKVADTYTFTLTDVIDGFSFDVLHTAGLIAKQPTGNTGHPLIVAEQLTPDGDPNPFFVQFTGNSTTQQIGFGFNSTGDGAPVGDTTFNNGGATHDMVTNLNEDWVSATQATNGVAGDTIQKGEVLTLRFFQENILSDVNPGAPGGGTERLDPTTSASGVVIKFDGIGSSEDLVVILDLKDALGNEITRAVNVQNSDLIKGNANVPPPYNAEFTLDNNDALLIIEQNDYTAAGETYQIQGMQIMQSSNGLTGDAINLNGATGANGGSSATSNLTAWDPTDNDVLKITDIGFVQQTSGTIPADLDFSFRLADADGDQTALQHIFLAIGH